MEVIAPEGTLVSIILDVFWISEKHKKNLTMNPEKELRHKYWLKVEYKGPNECEELTRIYLKWQGIMLHSKNGDTRIWICSGTTAYRTTTLQ